MPRVTRFAEAREILGPIRCFYARRGLVAPGVWLLDQQPANRKDILAAANARLAQQLAERSA